MPAPKAAALSVRDAQGTWQLDQVATQLHSIERQLRRLGTDDVFQYADLQRQKATPSSPKPEHDLTLTIAEERFTIEATSAAEQHRKTGTITQRNDGTVLLELSASPSGRPTLIPVLLGEQTLIVNPTSSIAEVFRRR